MTERLTYPTEQKIRSALIARMEAFSAATGRAPSMICREVMNDTSFYAKLKDGGNFTVATYQRFNDHFDKHWPKPPKAKRRNGHATK
jgi:hypothetical protein